MSTARKLRAICLSVIMVTSVVFGSIALTGSAMGATINQGSVSDDTAPHIDIANATIDPSSNSSIDANLNVSESGLTASELTVKTFNDTGSKLLLSESGDQGFASNNSGGSVTIPLSSVQENFTLKVVVENSSSGNILVTNTSSITVNDTTAPTVHDVSLNEDGSGNIVLTFTTSEQLGSGNSDIAVGVDGPSGPNVYSFSRSDFSEVKITDPRVTAEYQYSLSTTQSYDDGDGTYTARVVNAVDPAGNNGGNSGEGSGHSDSHSYSSGSNTDAFINGTVTDQNGNGLSGITMVAINLTSDSPTIKTTDSNGNYSIPVSSSTTYDVIADGDPDYTFDVKPGLSPAASSTVTANFSLKAYPDKGFINGTVVDADGNPVTNAPVDARDLGYRFGGSATTNASTGEFSIKVPAAKYIVRSRTSGKPPATKENVTVKANETTEITLKVPKPGYISGTVTQGGSPVTQGGVLIDGGGDKQFGNLNSSGGYNVSVKPGNYTVTYMGRDKTATSQAVTVTADNTTSADLTARKSTIKHSSVEVISGTGVQSSQIGVAAGLFSGMMQVKLTNKSSPGGGGIGGPPAELEGLGVTDSTKFRINITATNFTANSLMWGVGDARWNTSENATVQNGTDITITGTPVQLQVNFGGGGGVETGIGPLISKSPSDVSWPSGRNDRATDGRNQTVYFGIFDLGNLPGEFRNNLKGMSVTTNAQRFSTPSVVNESLRVWVAAPTKTVAGNDHTGFYQAEIPDSQLNEWGVTDPESELSALYKGDPANFTVTETSSGARILLENISYSAGFAEVQAGGGTGEITQSTSDAYDEAAQINITVDDGDGVNETSIDVYANNTNVTGGENVTLVENGSIINGTALGNNSITDGTNKTTETINLSAELKEGDYNLTVSARDANGSEISSSITNPAFNVDMAGKALRLVADDSNPFANTDDTSDPDEEADLRVTVVDRFGHNVTVNESDVNATAGELTASSPDTSANIQGIYNDTSSDTTPASDRRPTQAEPFYVNATNTEAEDVTIDIFDTGSDYTVSSDSATQTFSAQIGGVDVSVNRTQLEADNSTRAQIATQLTDGNGTVVERAGVGVTYSIANSSQAGVTRLSSTDTNNSGISTLTIVADTAGVTLDVTGIEQSTANGYSGSTSFETVSGNVDVSNSDFQYDGSTSDQSDDKVATEHTLLVDLEDPSGNAIEGFNAKLSANTSGASFGNTTITTNSSGQASTTVTLPKTKGTTQLNVTAGDFNASGTGDAQINVTSIAENTSALQFASDAPDSIAPNSEDNGIDIEAVDEFGNVNESTSSLSDVTLESSDTGVVDFDGSASDTQSLTNGVASFNVDANGTGTATLSATIPNANITNASQDLTVADPGSINLTVDRNVATSNATNSQTRTTATLTAQFLDQDGEDLGINSENISFARQSGDAAELDQSLDTFEKNTGSDGSGNVTIQVNGTSNTGETTFLAIAENFSVQGSVTVQTTGAAQSIQVTPDSSTLTEGETTNLTASFVDSSDRTVPRTEKITLSVDNGSFDGDRKKTTAFDSDVDGRAVAEFTYNSSGASAGDTDITAIGGGLSGSATITVENDTGAQVALDNVNLDPDTVDSNTTNDHDLSFDVTGASDDGNSDTFTIEIPSAATLESANSVTVTDSNGTDVSLDQGPDVSGNTITFDVAPDSSADTRDLTVEANVTVSAPDVGNETTADIEINVSDSDNGADNATATLTVQPEDFVEPADFRVSNVQPDGANVTAGDELNVTADVENVGGKNDTQTVEFRLDTDQNGTLEADEELANGSISLNVSENATVIVENVSTDGLDAGDYTHGVFSDNDSATAMITIEDGEDDPLDQFRNENGVVDSAGLLDAAAAFRNGEIGSQVLLDAAAEFRNQN